MLSSAHSARIATYDRVFGGSIYEFNLLKSLITEKKLRQVNKVNKNRQKVWKACKITKINL